MSSQFFSSEEDGNWKHGNNTIDWGEINLENSKHKKGGEEWDDFSFRGFDQVAAKTSPLKSKTDARMDDEKQSETKKAGSKSSQLKSSSSSRKKSSVDEEPKTKISKEESMRKNKDKSTSRKESSPSPKKQESRKVSKETSSRSNKPERSDDARKEKSGSSKKDDKKEERKSRSEEKDSQHQKSHRDLSKKPSSRRHSTQVDEQMLSQSRQRAVQRAEARNSWREAHGGAGTQPKGKSSNGSDDLLDVRRSSLLDQSRKGPIRSSSVRGRHRGDDDDDDDDFSVLSGMSSSSFMVDDHLDAPFPSKGLRRASSYHPGGSGSVCGGDDCSTSSYLPNFLSNSNPQGGGNGGFQRKERRPSAFGTGHERAQAIYSLKNDLDRDSDEDDDESCSGMSVYSLPTGLARSNGSHFEIDRSSKAGASARRPSLSTVLTIPCINGIEDDDDPTGDPSFKADRRGSMSSNQDPDSGKRGGANYDSTVEDMLKNRRLRGARGDAAKKKKEEKVKKKDRKLSMKLFTNLVQSTLSSDKADNAADTTGGNNRSSDAPYSRRSSSVV